MTVISIEAVGNWVNFNGSALSASEGVIKRSRDIRISPSEFYVDIRTIKIKSESGPWVTLLDKSLSGNREIVGTTSIPSRSPVKPAEYTTILVGIGKNWFLRGIYTNSIGIPINFSITNTNSVETEYFLFSTPKEAKKLTNSDGICSNAAVSLINSRGYIFKSGDYKQIYLFFDTLGMINVSTDSQGNISNVSISRPTLDININ